MLTFPFIQVEGSIALPRLRPLDRIPASFGREWMLSPPHFSLRAELRALYAAIMRTVCLSGEAFREVCRWDLQRHLFPEPSAAPVRPRATLKASWPPARAKASPHVDQALEQVLEHAHYPLPRHAPAPGTHRLAGGACAVGGAALLAWIVASHTPHGTHDATISADASPIRSTDDTPSQRLADARAAHEYTNTTAATTGAAASASQTSRAVDAAQRSSQRAATANTSAAVGTPAAHRSTDRPDYAATNPPAARLRATLSDHGAKTAEGRAHKNRESVRGRAARERIIGVPRIESGRHSAQALGPHRVAPPVTTQRTIGMHSEASSYSPRQSSLRQDDEYASIVTYANTHTAARAASRPSVPVDSTEWVNHLSQRRVTEIPDRFGK